MYPTTSPMPSCVFSSAIAGQLVDIGLCPFETASASCRAPVADRTCSGFPEADAPGPEVAAFHRKPRRDSDGPLLRERMASILLREPMSLGSDGTSAQRIMPLVEHISQYADGRISFPRLALFHRLLCRGKAPSEVLAVENGPSHILLNALAISHLGSRVVIKEPNKHHLRMFLSQRQLLPAHLRSLIICLGDLDAIHAPLAADIVYWANPSPFMHPGYSDLCVRLPVMEDRELLDYMGRDVVHGGFLLIQTDQQRYMRLVSDPRRWERILFQELRPSHGASGTVLCTANYAQDNGILVFRRQDEAAAG